MKKVPEHLPLNPYDAHVPPVRTTPLPPDPSGPPQAAKGLGLGAAATIVVVAGGAAFTLMSGQMNACRGATRSSRLVWEERQAEIDAAIAAETSIDTVAPDDGHRNDQP